MAKKQKKQSPTKRLFRDPSGQGHMFEKSLEEELEAKKNAPVECLGMTFPNDEERRKYFLEKLREKLKAPEFRKIEGFPIAWSRGVGPRQVVDMKLNSSVLAPQEGLIMRFSRGKRALLRKGQTVR